MLARILPIILIFFFFAGCEKTVSENTVTKNTCNIDLETNEIEVISVVVENLSKQASFDGKSVIIINQTISTHEGHNLSERLKLESSRFPNLEPSMIVDFELKNSMLRSFDKVLKLSHQYDYISKTDFDIASENNSYSGKTDQLQKRFPNSIGQNGVLGFSRVGFNEDFTKAIVYSFRWHEHGSFFFLEKENCNWKLRKEEMIWFT